MITLPDRSRGLAVHDDRPLEVFETPPPKPAGHVDPARSDVNIGCRERHRRDARVQPVCVVVDQIGRLASVATC